MKRLPLFAILLFAPLAQSAVAETWYWSPSRQSTLDNGDKVYYWQDGQNWTNSAAARGAPTRGDTAVLGRGHADGGPYGICEDGENSALHEVRFEGGQTVAMSHGSLMLQGGGGGLAYLLDADSTDNRAGLCLVGDGEVPVHVARNRSFALQTGVKKSGDGTPALVKTGPGRFVCFGQAGSGEYTVPLTLVRQGAYDITTDSTLDGVTIAFDGNDGSQRIVYCHRPEDRLDLKLKDIGFYETNGVANTEHGFSSQNDNQVKFTGAPRQNPTVFSGTFYSKSGLDWAPDSEDCMFVCSNAVSATAGAVIVTKGTVKLVTGASFTSLSRLNVAAGATFEVAAGSGANFHADALKLEDATAKLRLGTAVELTMGAATLDGIPLLHGTYTADGADDTHQAAWIEGAGSVTVENGPDQVDTWCGGGADNLATTDANWESGEAPDITAGDLVAIFATGGTRADLPAGTAAAFDGIVLDGANLDDGHFELAAGSGATATIGASALTVADAPSATTWTIRWPITLAGGAQTWNVGANNTVEFDAPIDGEQDLAFAGSGTAKLNAENTHSGTLKVASGTLSLAGSWANCENLVVAGGTFAVKNENAFGDDRRPPGEDPKLKVDVTSGASLVLDYDGHIDCAAFRVDGARLYGTFGAPGSGADHEYAWISGTGLMCAGGYAGWAGANGVSGAWDAKGADGIHNVFRYAFDRPTGAFADPPLLSIAFDAGGGPAVLTPPLVNAAGFDFSLLATDDAAGTSNAVDYALDPSGTNAIPGEIAPARFFRLKATEAP
jgi:autotransporter-associated beta strand protein